MGWHDGGPLNQDPLKAHILLWYKKKPSNPKFSIPFHPLPAHTPPPPLSPRDAPFSWAPRQILPPPPRLRARYLRGSASGPSPWLRARRPSGSFDTSTLHRPTGPLRLVFSERRMELQWWRGDAGHRLPPPLRLCFAPCTSGPTRTAPPPWATAG